LATVTGPDIRFARHGDAPAIARIHAESWRQHYRGMYADHYLDGDLYSDRLATWTERLKRDPARHFTLIAEHGRDAAGFAHVTLDGDPAWGSLVDNLHVLHSERGMGTGTRLLARLAEILRDRRPDAGLYLWVLDKNAQAIRFYERRGGVLSDSEPSAPPAGNPANLVPGTRRIRVTWSSLEAFTSARNK
jgi:GNAT superfamily N-acetyltransferase